MSNIIAIVTGSRDWDDSAFIESRLVASCCSTVVQGGCLTGADRIARDWAKYFDIEIVTYKANWNKYGRAAGPLRNRRMLEPYKDNPNAIVMAFRLNKSRGTTTTIDIANEFKMDLRIYDRNT